MVSATGKIVEALDVAIEVAEAVESGNARLANQVSGVTSHVR